MILQGCPVESWRASLPLKKRQAIQDYLENNELQGYVQTRDVLRAAETSVLASEAAQITENSINSAVQSLIDGVCTVGLGNLTRVFEQLGNRDAFAYADFMSAAEGHLKKLELDRSNADELPSVTDEVTDDIISNVSTAFKKKTKRPARSKKPNLEQTTQGTMGTRYSAEDGF